jgi:hypothetical protein
MTEEQYQSAAVLSSMIWASGQASGNLSGFRSSGLMKEPSLAGSISIAVEAKGLLRD